MVYSGLQPLNTNKTVMTVIAARSVITNDNYEYVITNPGNIPGGSWGSYLFAPSSDIPPQLKQSFVICIGSSTDKIGKSSKVCVGVGYIDVDPTASIADQTCIPGRKAPCALNMVTALTVYVKNVRTIHIHFLQLNSFDLNISI